MAQTIKEKVTFVQGEATRIGQSLTNKEIRNELQMAYDRLVETVAAVYRKKNMRDSEKAMSIASYARRMGAIERAMSLL